MARRRSPLFVERETYRRRRLLDAARMLPVVGLVAVLLPVLWSAGGQTNTAGEGVYLFVLWAVMVAVAALLARPLRDEQDRPRNQNPAPPPGDGPGG